MRKWNSESGQVLVLTALSMSMILGFLGLAADVGQLFHAKRNMQAAVDSAAIAATVNLQKEESTTLTTDAKNAASAALAANGFSGVTISTSFSSSVTSPTLYISSPPNDGPNAGRTDFVEAILTVPQSTVFMSLFGAGTINVGTRAVAGVGNISNTFCLNSQSINASQAVYLYGNFTLDAPGCGVEINSNNSDALDFGGAKGTMTAGYIDVNGGDGGHTGDATPTPTTNTQALYPDPYQSIVWPNTGNGGCSGTGLSWTIVGNNPPSGTTVGTTDSTTTVIGGSGNNAPGYNAVTGLYTPKTANVGDAICFTKTVTLDGSAATGLELGAGIYVFEQGLSITTNSSVFSGPGGTTLEVVNGSMSLPTSGVNFCNPALGTNGCLNNSNTGLFAPTTGQTADFVILEPAPNNNQLLYNKGTDTGNITGMIYAPDANLYLHDNAGSLSVYGKIIVSTVQDQASTLNLHDLPSAWGTNGPKIVTLVE